MTRCVSDAVRPRGLLERMGLDGAPITAVLIAANLLVFVGQLAYVRDVAVLSGRTWNDPVLDARVTAGALAFGANYAPFVFREWRVEILVTSCFIHFSLLHIAFNVAGLRQLGGVVERTVGHERMSTMYLASGIVGAGVSAAWGWFRADPDRTSAGASGAICGVLGAALVLGLRVQGIRSPLARSMLLGLVIIVFAGHFLGSDNAAHLGGAFTGAVFALAWREGVVHTRLRSRLAIGLCAATVLASGAVVLVHDLTDPWATMNAGARIEYAEAALNGASCRDAAIATDRAARLTPRSDRVRELKKRILIGCRPGG
jgi:rhomboid protease GluP